MAIQLITFDLDNTLWPVEPVIVRAEEKLQAHLQEVIPERREQLSSAALREVRSQLLSERPDYRHDLTALRRDSIERALVTLGLEAHEARERASRAFDVFYAARNEVQLFPGARAALRRLGERYTLGALTNGNADVRRAGLGKEFAFQYSAESIGRRKPAPDMFHAALEYAGVAPSEAVHVGDHPLEDVEAAQRVGMRAVWANPLEVEWTAQLEQPPSFSRYRELDALIRGM